MNDKNQVQKQPNKAKDVARFITSDVVQKRIKDVIGANAGDFTASLVSAVQTNSTLAECEQSSLVNSAFVAASLNLPINQSLGFAYLVPFKNNKKGVKEAQFQIGYKGFIQLALRTEQYKIINTVEVKEGEYTKGNRNRLTGVIHFDWIDDDLKREKLKTIGYVAYLELHNGFEKTVYWSKEKMVAHALEFSQAYKYDIKEKKKPTDWNAGYWLKDFDAMALKTIIKRLITKWGIMTTELTKAVTMDQSIVDEEGNPVYPDNDKELQKEELAPSDEVNEFLSNNPNMFAKAKEKGFNLATLTKKQFEELKAIDVDFTEVVEKTGEVKTKEKHNPYGLPEDQLI